MRFVYITAAHDPGADGDFGANKHRSEPRHTEPTEPTA
jgi:hypothetical protein